MCEKKMCLSGKRELCSCEALKAGDVLTLLLHIRENMRDMEWEFDYTSLSRPEHRRLCASGVCRRCGGCLCSSIELDDTAAGEELLEMAYRHLYRYERNMSCKDFQSFRERFVNMFHEQDRAFVREWLNRSLETVCRNNKQPVRIYTILRSGADADRGIFTNPYAEGSYCSRERAREELARLVEEEKGNLSERLDTIDEGEDYWEACEDGYAAAHFTRLEIVTSELTGFSRPCSPEALSVTQFTRIMGDCIPDCGRLGVFAWIAFAVYCIEGGQYIHLESSGSYERDIQEWLAGVCAGLLNVRREFGTEIAAQICGLAVQSDCLYPWEMYPAAERLKERGNLDDIGELINSGEIDDYGTPIPPLSDFVDLSKYSGEVN